MTLRSDGSTTFSYAEVLEARGRGVDVIAAHTIPGELPAKPFVAWLRAMYQEEAKANPYNLPYLMPCQAVPAAKDLEAFAEGLGTTGRLCRALMAGERRAVRTTVVDRALTYATRIAEVDGHLIFGLDDLYPEIADQSGGNYSNDRTALQH